MKKKVVLTYFSGIMISFILSFEVLDRGDYLFMAMFLGLILGIILVAIKQVFGKYILSLSLAILTSWIAVIVVGQYQSQRTYEVIKSINKNDLINYVESGDINFIPENKRTLWIGLRPQNIKIIKKNRVEKIVAVGWKRKVVFGYYDFTNKKYVTSIK